MCTKTQLKEFLELMSEEVKFVVFDYVSSEKFTVQMKCKINQTETTAYYNNYVKNWINQFSALTHTAWVLDAYRRYGKHLRYRKSYFCHRRFAENKNNTTQNRPCEAAIDLEIKFIDGDTLKIDPDLQKGLNMTININFEHYHLVNDMGSFNFLNSSSDSVFYEYFADGYLPIAAKLYHMLRLKEKYWQDSEELANPKLYPTALHVQNLYEQRWRQTEINVNDVIKRKAETLGRLGFTTGYNAEENPFVVIVTPLMKRVISQIGVRRVLVDATAQPGTPDALFLYVPSVIGSLPVACALFSEGTEAMYVRIFFTIKLAIENGCDNINFTPELLLHDDNLEIKQAISKAFPNAMTKLNRFSLCRDIWRWICAGRPHLPASNLNLMSIFKDMVYAKSEDDALLFYNHIGDRSVLSTWRSKVEDVWQARQQWLDESGLGEGFNDAPIAFLKEFILQLCTPFNGFLPAMVDVVTNVIEPHYHKILLSHRDGDLTNVYTKFLARLRIDDLSEILIADGGPVEYYVRDPLKKRIFYQLSMRMMCCVCNAGKMGRMCEHLCGVFKLTDNTSVSFSSLNDNDKDIFLNGTTTVNSEYEHDLIIEEAAIVDESFETMIKDECEDPRDPLEGTDAGISFACGDTTGDELEGEYEAGMKALNDEFERLNKLFKENPNRTNLYTMQQLEKELAKIVFVQEVDTSGMFAASNAGTGES